MKYRQGLFSVIPHKHRGKPRHLGAKCDLSARTLSLSQLRT
jgi:hypothetical protein